MIDLIRSIENWLETQFRLEGNFELQLIFSSSQFHWRTSYRYVKWRWKFNERTHDSRSIGVKSVFLLLTIFVWLFTEWDGQNRWSQLWKRFVKMVKKIDHYVKIVVQPIRSSGEKNSFVWFLYKKSIESQFWPKLRWIVFSCFHFLLLSNIEWTHMTFHLN